jgi:hypothetical protein
MEHRQLQLPPERHAPQQALLSLTGTATITIGQQVTLGSRLTDERTSAGIPGEQVNLFARRAGTAGDQAAGTATFTVAPAATTTYRVSFPGSETYGTADSPQVTVTVTPTVSARLQVGTIALGKTITVTGTVAPNHRGQRVYLQRLVNGAWKGAATATLTSASAYILRATPPVRGTLTYWVVKRADTDHTSATSPSLRVTVR